MKSKPQTFIGFAVRKRALVTGTNAVDATRDRIYLMLVCDSASQNTKQEAQKIATKKRCPLYLSKQLLDELTGKQNCKVAAMCDAQLAAAFVQYADDTFTLISGGRNAHGGKDSN